MKRRDNRSAALATEGQRMLSVCYSRARGPNYSAITAGRTEAGSARSQTFAKTQHGLLGPNCATCRLQLSHTRTHIAQEDKLSFAFTDAHRDPVVLSISCVLLREAQPSGGGEDVRLSVSQTDRLAVLVSDMTPL